MKPEIIMQGGSEPLTSCVSMESFEQICHERDALESKLIALRDAYIGYDNSISYLMGSHYYFLDGYKEDSSTAKEGFAVRKQLEQSRKTFEKILKQP